MTCLETYEHEGITVKIYPDEHSHGDNGCREWSNLGVMYWWHPDYTLGGSQDEEFHRGDHDTMWDAFWHLVTEESAVAIAPLFLLDHSGISIRTGAFWLRGEDGIVDLKATRRFMGDEAGWDTTMCGFIYTTKAKQEEIGTDDQYVVQCLEEEIKLLDREFTGDVYGYVLDLPEGLEFAGDSCWGFYGIEDVKEQANEAAEGAAEELNREKNEARYWAERDTVTV